MTLLFVYDHLMDSYEFKRNFPKVKFKFLSTGRVDNYKINWSAKGLPFVCRKRPTLVPFLNKKVYGIVLELSNNDEVLIKKYIHYLPNNLLIDIEIILEVNQEELAKYSHLSDFQLENLKTNFETQIGKIIKGKTFAAETFNLILDKTYIESLLIKGGDEILKSEYFRDIKKLSENINPMFPSDKYIAEISRIANMYKLPKQYIQESLNVSKKQNLSWIESVLRNLISQYMHIIALFQQQEIGFGIIDLLWEIDPLDALVFEDYDNINHKIIVFIITLVLMLFLPILILYSVYVWCKTY